MSRADLAADLKASLRDSAGVFNAPEDADFKALLDTAALDLPRRRPRTLFGTLALVAGQARYDAPTDYRGFKSHLWGIAPVALPKPWDPAYPSDPMPDVLDVEDEGLQKLELRPPPSAAQIWAIGAEFRYYYYGIHRIEDEAAETTVKPADRAVLLLRAQIEAMTQLMFRNIHKVTSMRDAISGQPRNGTPAGVRESLLAQYEAA